MILRAKADSPWRAQREQQLRWRGWSRSLPATMLIGLAARRGVFCIKKQRKNSADTNKNTNK